MFRLCLGSVYVLSMLSLCSTYVLSIFHIIHSVYLPTMFRYLRSVWTSKETEVDPNIALACTGCYYSWNELCQPRQKCNLSRGSSDRVLAMQVLDFFLALMELHITEWISCTSRSYLCLNLWEPLDLQALASFYFVTLELMFICSTAWANLETNITSFHPLMCTFRQYIKW